MSCFSLITHFIQPVLPIDAWVWSIHWSMGHHQMPQPQERMILLFLVAITVMALQGVGAGEHLHNLCPEIWLAWSYADTHSCYVLLRAFAMSYPEDSTSLFSSPPFCSYFLSTSGPLGSLCLGVCVCVWTKMAALASAIRSVF